MLDELNNIQLQLQEELSQLHSDQLRITPAQNCILVMLELNKLKQVVDRFKCTVDSYDQVKQDISKQVDQLSDEYNLYVKRLATNCSKLQTKMRERGFNSIEEFKLYQTIKNNQSTIGILRVRINELEQSQLRLKQQLSIKQESIKLYQAKIRQLNKKVDSSLHFPLFTDQFKESHQKKLSTQDNSFNWEQISSKSQANLYQKEQLPIKIQISEHANIQSTTVVKIDEQVEKRMNDFISTMAGQQSVKLKHKFEKLTSRSNHKPTPSLTRILKSTNQIKGIRSK